VEVCTLPLSEAIVPYRPLRRQPAQGRAHLEGRLLKWKLK